MDHEERLKALLDDLGKFAHDVADRVTELKKSPDSPERQAELDGYKNAMLGIHDALGRLYAAASKQKDTLPNS